MLQAALPVHTILELAAAVAAAALVWRLIAVRRREVALIAASAINEESLQRTIDDAPIGLAMVGLDGSWLRVNAAICELVGSPADALLKLTFQDITHPEDLATDFGLVQQTIRGEIPGYTMEKRYLHRDGRVVPVELHVSIVRTADSQPLHFIAQIVDLTRRAAAERALRRQEAAFAALVEEADDVIIRYDTNHRIRSANPATTRGNRIDSPSLIGRRVDELGIDSELAERWNAVLARVIATGESEKFEYSFPHPDGSAREWQVRFTAERGDDGRASGVFAVSRDITDLQKANAALRQREQEFVTLAENAEEMIVRYDLAGRYRYANPAALTVLQRSLHEVLGRRPDELFTTPPEIVRAWAERNAQAIHERQSVRSRSPPTRRVAQGSSSPLRHRSLTNSASPRRCWSCPETSPPHETPRTSWSAGSRSWSR